MSIKTHLGQVSTMEYNGARPKSPRVKVSKLKLLPPVRETGGIQKNASTVPRLVEPIAKLKDNHKFKQAQPNIKKVVDRFEIKSKVDDKVGDPDKAAVDDKDKTLVTKNKTSVVSNNCTC